MQGWSGQKKENNEKRWVSVCLFVCFLEFLEHFYNDRSVLFLLMLKFIWSLKQQGIPKTIICIVIVQAPLLVFTHEMTNCLSRLK